VGERLITPSLKADVFPGITRLVFLELASQCGIETQEAEMRRSDLVGIDGAFVCSTLMEIRAVSALGESSVPTMESPVYKRLVSAFRSLTRQS